ncbi:hypothetical protein BDR26DRAFT_921454 [Obelidium mucronatum]|nr:hypothetical protein BDR26DRAFT_921454 [Obelidium mucronatum]
MGRSNRSHYRQLASKFMTLADKLQLQNMEITKKITIYTFFTLTQIWAYGKMVTALDYESRDSRFDPWYARFFHFRTLNDELRHEFGGIYSSRYLAKMQSRRQQLLSSRKGYDRLIPSSKSFSGFRQEVPAKFNNPCGPVPPSGRSQLLTDNDVADISAFGSLMS